VHSDANFKYLGDVTLTARIDRSVREMSSVLSIYGEPAGVPFVCEFDSEFPYPESRSLRAVVSVNGYAVVWSYITDLFPDLASITLMFTRNVPILNMLYDDEYNEDGMQNVMRVDAAGAIMTPRVGGVPDVGIQPTKVVVSLKRRLRLK
jgi:hypothetical protein